MRPDLEKQLFDRFSMYLPDRSIQQGLMAFGFECGNGWFNLIWDLSEVVERLVTTEQEPGWDPFEVVQVKEKFGGLRWYTNWTTGLISFVVNAAELVSVHTCEVCGSNGTRHGYGWIVTMCDLCYYTSAHRYVHPEDPIVKEDALTYDYREKDAQSRAKQRALSGLPSYVWTPTVV